MTTQREQQILDIVQQNPLIAQQTLADQLGISRSAVAVHLMNLMQKGEILGKGYVIAPKKQVLVIGGANMDISGNLSITPQAGDSTPGQVFTSAGGVARNIAENLARLGHKVKLLTALGNDIYGQKLLEHTQQAGVDMSDSWILNQSPTSTYLSIHLPDGNMLAAVNDMAILEEINSARLQEKQDKLKNASCVVLDCNLSPASLEYLFSQVQNAAVFVDTVSAVKCQRILPWLEWVHTLKPNRLEAETLTGISLDHPKQAPIVAQALHDKGVKQVILSFAELGLFFSHHKGEQFWQKPIPAQIMNVTGAGDALCAGLVHGFFDNLSPVQTMQFASACAAFTASTHATNHPSLSKAAIQHLLKPYYPNH